jgi:hypothetical protein
MRRRADPDHLRPRSAFTAEGNLKAKHARKRLRTTQPSSNLGFLLASLRLGFANAVRAPQR